MQSTPTPSRESSAPSSSRGLNSRNPFHPRLRSALVIAEESFVPDGCACIAVTRHSLKSANGSGTSRTQIHEFVAVSEVIRMESQVPYFTRRTTSNQISGKKNVSKDVSDYVGRGPRLRGIVRLFAGGDLAAGDFGIAKSAYLPCPGRCGGIRRPAKRRALPQAACTPRLRDGHCPGCPRQRGN